MMKAERKKVEPERRHCPYCDEEIAEASFPYCHACEVTILHCPKCGKAVSRDSKKCSNCGAEIKG